MARIIGFCNLLLESSNLASKPKLGLGGSMSIRLAGLEIEILSTVSLTAVGLKLNRLGVEGIG